MVEKGQLTGGSKWSTGRQDKLIDQEEMEGRIYWIFYSWKGPWAIIFKMSTLLRRFPWSKKENLPMRIENSNITDLFRNNRSRISISFTFFSQFSFPPDPSFHPTSQSFIYIHPLTLLSLPLLQFFWPMTHIFGAISLLSFLLHPHFK